MPGTLVHHVAVAALLAAGLGFRAEAQRPGIRPAEPTVRFELFPFAGYQFGGGLNVTGGHVSLGDGLSYGGYLDVLTRKGTWVELGYNRHESELRLDNGFGVSTKVADMAVQYFQLGALQELKPGPARPFLVGSLGVTWFDPSDNLDGTTRFSFGAGAGVKFSPQERFGIRLEGRAWFSLFPDGGALSCGPFGCFVAVGGTALVQGQFSGGIFFAF